MLVYGQDERVTRWVAAQVGDSEPPPAYASIGFERDGELVAGVFFDNYTGTNIFAHIAFRRGEMFPRPLLSAVRTYAIDQLKVRRMTFVVRDTNRECIRFVQKLGAKAEARLHEAHPEGDLLLWVVWHDNPTMLRLTAPTTRSLFSRGN